jgi:hypothetical protein
LKLAERKSGDNQQRMKEEEKKTKKEKENEEEKHKPIKRSLIIFRFAVSTSYEKNVTEKQKKKKK